MEKLNISYSEKTIRVAGFNSKGILNIIDEIDYIDSRVFFLEPKINKSRISEFSSILSNLLKKNNLNFNTANIILDTRLADFLIIPLDYSDEIENVNSSLIWEISNIYPDTYKNYKVSYQKLNNNDITFSKFGNTLAIIYHKNISEILKKISEITNILFAKMNFDIFATAAFLQKYNNDFIILNCKKSKTDVCFYLKKSLKLLKSLYYDDINNQLFKNKLIELMNINEFRHLKNIYICGEREAQFSADVMHKQFPQKEIMITDPFAIQNISLPESLKINPYSYPALFYDLK